MGGWAPSSPSIPKPNKQTNNPASDSRLSTPPPTPSAPPTPAAPARRRVALVPTRKTTSAWIASAAITFTWASPRWLASVFNRGKSAPTSISTSTGSAAPSAANGSVRSSAPCVPAPAASAALSSSSAAPSPSPPRKMAWFRPPSRPSSRRTRRWKASFSACDEAAASDDRPCGVAAAACDPR